MFNTIRLKVLTVALALLAVFGAAVGASAWLVKSMVEQIDSIAVYHIPLGAHVASIEALTLELELQLRRALAQLPLEGPRLAELRKRHREIAGTLRNDVKQVHVKLAEGITDRRNDVDGRIALAGLKGSFAFIETRLGQFLRAGDAVLAGIESGDPRRAGTAMAALAPYEDVFGKELAKVRQTLDGLTLASVTKTSANQLNSRRLNSTLFAVAAVVGLVLFLVLMYRLKRSVTALLAGIREVEAGRLDVAVPVTSRDELGRLTEAFNRMAAQLKERERIKDTFGRYFDPQIVSRLIGAEGESPTLSRRPATVFCSGIEGFRDMGESLTASVMVNVLNTYFSEVTREVCDRQGIVDKFIGDAVIAYWTTPFSADDRHAADACLAALAQREAIDAFRGDLPQITGLLGDAPDFVVRMGLATGDAVVGTIGSHVARSYTVVGDVVNVASRLQGVSRLYGTDILIDEATYRLAQAAIEARELDLLTIAGRSEPLRVYELVGRSGARPPELADLHEIFAAGLAAYRAGDWDTAERRFAECLTRKNDDGPSRVFQHRVKILRATPPPPDWDGVWRHTDSEPETELLESSTTVLPESDSAIRS